MVATVDRDGLVAVQTPQAFAADALRAAHAGGGDATDDAGLLEAAGLVVGTVPGDPRNLKLTRPEDLALAEALLAGAQRVSARPRPAGGSGHRRPPVQRRPRPATGAGRRRDRRVRACAGLAGHSDADAVAHAIADAVLGAAGLGDLGRHMPDTDPLWARGRLPRPPRRVVALAAGAGWVPVNADCTVVAERPRLAPHVDRMAERLVRRAGRSGQRQGHPGRGPRGTGPGRGDRLHRGGAAEPADDLAPWPAEPGDGEVR